MLNTTEWHQAGRIILQIFSGDVSLAEMEQGWRDVAALIEADTGKLAVHLLLDFSQRQKYEPELFKLPTMRRLFDLSKETRRLGWFMVIQAAPNPIMLFTSTLAARLTNRKLRIVGSIDEALNFLRYTDSSLVDDSENP